MIRRCSAIQVFPSRSRKSDPMKDFHIALDARQAIDAMSRLLALVARCLGLWGIPFAVHDGAVNSQSCEFALKRGRA
jgi:hypothetical protein